MRLALKARLAPLAQRVLRARLVLLALMALTARQVLLARKAPPVFKVRPVLMVQMV